MRKLKQRHRHDPANGVFGDCYRTAIACLLDRETPEDVPHWYEDGGSMEANLRLERWLWEQGLVLYQLGFRVPEGETDLEARDNLIRSVSESNPGEPWMLAGTSSIGSPHVVICQDGQIVWDPSQRDTGIVGPLEEADGNPPQYAVEFLAGRRALPLEPEA